MVAPTGVPQTIATSMPANAPITAKAAEQSLAQASAETVPDDTSAALKIDSGTSSDEPSLPELPTVDTSISEPDTSSNSVPEPTVSEAFDSAPEDDSAKYGQMLQDALDSVNNMPAEPATPIMSQPDPEDNPAMASAPTVPSNPEINGVPEMNFMPDPGTDILPPPPAPPIGLSEDSTSPDTALPVAGAPTTPLGSQPAMQDQVYHPQASDPGAFKIPGM